MNWGYGVVNVHGNTLHLFRQLVQLIFGQAIRLRSDSKCRKSNARTTAGRFDSIFLKRKLRHDKVSLKQNVLA